MNFENKVAKNKLMKVNDSREPKPNKTKDRNFIEKTQAKFLLSGFMQICRKIKNYYLVLNTNRSHCNSGFRYITDLVTLIFNKFLIIKINC